MTQTEALRLALEALIDADHLLDAEGYGHAFQQEAITAIKAALSGEAQQVKDEPVAYIRVSKTGNVMACAKSGDFYALPDKTLLYTTPPQRKPLSEEEIGAILEDVNAYGTRLYTFARAIEAAHGIKGEA